MKNSPCHHFALKYIRHLRAMTFAEHLETITPLSPAFLEVLNARVTVERYLPHQVIHAAGQVERRLWWVGAGLLRQYAIDVAGKELTTGFFREGELVFSLEGYRKVPAGYYTEALEICELYAVPYAAVRELSVYEDTGILTAHFLQQQAEKYHLRVQLLTVSTEERYRLLRQRQGWLFARASVKQIAAYLNMTREHLSRLMARDL